MTPLGLPVQPPMWGVATITVTRDTLRAMLGDPHYIETDPFRTCGGEEDCWAFTLPSGQRFMIILEVTTARAELYGDPPDAPVILKSLAFSPQDPRITCHAEPWLLK